MKTTTIAITFLLFTLNLFGQRYLSNQFTAAQITTTDYVYATVHKSKCWNNAPTNSTDCFWRGNYTLPAFNPNPTYDSIKLAIRIFRNSSDPVTTPKPTILFVQGGGMPQKDKEYVRGAEMMKTLIFVHILQEKGMS